MNRLSLAITRIKGRITAPIHVRRLQAELNDMDFNLDDFSVDPETTQQRELREAQEGYDLRMSRAGQYAEAKARAIEGEKMERLAAEAQKARIAILKQATTSKARKPIPVLEAVG